MNRKAITEPTRNSATASTMPMLPARSPVWSTATGLRSLLTSCAAMPSGSAPRESLAECGVRCESRKGSSARDCKDFSLPPRGALEPHHVADHLGHRLVMLGRHLFVDLDSRRQRARKRRVLDDRDVLLGPDLADLERDVVEALGDANWCVHPAIILQSDRIVRRVRDDHGRLRHRGHHALAGTLL